MWYRASSIAEDLLRYFSIVLKQHWPSMPFFTWFFGLRSWEIITTRSLSELLNSRFWDRPFDGSIMVYWLLAARLPILMTLHVSPFRHIGQSLQWFDELDSKNSKTWKHSAGKDFFYARNNQGLLSKENFFINFLKTKIKQPITLTLALIYHFPSIQLIRQLK